jgi:hypothetical protein
MWFSTAGRVYVLDGTDESNDVEVLVGVLLLVGDSFCGLSWVYGRAGHGGLTCLVELINERGPFSSKLVGTRQTSITTTNG